MDKLDFIKISNHHPVLFYDGVCILCNGLVNFLIRKDRNKAIKYIPLQSDSAKKFLAHQGIESENLDTVVLLIKGRLYIKSSASIRAVSQVPGIWKICKLGLIIPAFIRNFFYDFIAKKRYSWFGQSTHCMIPSEEIQDRFLVDIKKV